MLQGLFQSAGRLWTDLNQSFLRERGSVPADGVVPKLLSERYQPLRRLFVTDGVGRTLFDEFANHRAEARGDEEIGWCLLGLREPDEAVALATLPAGAGRDASKVHVRFNSGGQALASRIVRQADRRLVMLGIVHTHPGSLRHPSDGDFRGDIEWVRVLRGRQGVFGIGTADAEPPNGTLFAQQPKAHVQCLGDLRLSWYTLRDGDKAYRPLPVELTLGPDLARPLHSVWPMIEAHAERLDRLHRQQAGVTFEVAEGKQGPALAVNIPLAEPGQSLRVLLEGTEVRYYCRRDGELFAADCPEDRVDRGVYLLLAELAKEV